MKFLRASMIVAAFMLLGRITGFLREIVIAKVGGASQQSDVIIVFLTFPDMMISLLLGGGLMAALVPSFRSLPDGAGFALFLRTGLLIAAIFVALALVTVLFSQQILGFLSPGWTEMQVTQVLHLFHITVIALPITAVSGVVVAFLNSKERFAFGAIGTLIFNSCLITAMLIPTNLSPSVAIVVGILGGSSLRLIVQLSATKRYWNTPDFSFPYNRGDLLRRFAGSFGFYSILALLPPLARAYASLIEAGALSMFNYAYKLMELPMAIIVTAIVTVLLPRLSGHVRNVELEQAAHTLGLAIRAGVVLLLGIAIVTCFQAETIVHFVFWGANFTLEQFHDLGFLVALGFVGVPFQGLVLLYGAAFVSYNRTGVLVLVSTIMVIFVGISAPFLQSKWGIEGLMLAYVVAQMSGAIVLTVLLVRTAGAHPLKIAFNKPFCSILLPSFSCLAVSWAFNQTNFWHLPALLLSSGVFFGIHIAADPSVLQWLKKRTKT